MEMDLITRKDLSLFKRELVEELTNLLQEPPSQEKWLRSADVRKMLSISDSTLLRLRVRHLIPYTRIDNTYLYPKSKIDQLLEENLSTESPILL